mgnify:CR=1 FL=1
MENSDSYSEIMGQANLFRNANFSALQEKANMYIDKEKEEKAEIEGVTMPLEIPLIDKFGGRVGKRVMEKLGMKSEEDDGLMKTLAKKGLNSLLEKAGLKKPDAKPTKPDDEDDDKDEPTKPDDEDDKDEPIEDDEDDEIQGFDASPELRAKADSDMARNELQNQHAVADSEIDRNQQIVDNDAQLYDESDVRMAQSKIDAHQQFKEDNPLPEKEDNPLPEEEENFGESGIGKAGDDSLRIGTDAKSAVSDGLGEEPELLTGVKSAVSDATTGLKDTVATGLKDTLIPGVKDAVTTGLKDTVTTGLKDVVSSGGKSLAERLAAKAAAVEGEGGGPEDLGSDIVSAGLAIGAMFASIFGKHIKHPDIQTQEPSLIATQGYGLAEQ